MVPHNEPGDRAFWCISDKCLNPGCSRGRRPGARVQAGFYPAPSCPLLSVRLAGPRLIFVPPVHFSTIPVPQQLPFCVPTPPTDVGSCSRDRDGRGRCVVKCVGGRGASSPAGRGPAPDQDSGARPTALPGVGQALSHLRLSHVLRDSCPPGGRHLCQRQLRRLAGSGGCVYTHRTGRAWVVAKCRRESSGATGWTLPDAGATTAGVR